MPSQTTGILCSVCIPLSAGGPQRSRSLISPTSRLTSCLGLSPHDDLSPRRSPVVNTGLDEPGGSRAEMQSTKREEMFHLQASLDGRTSPEQEWTNNLLQADVRVKPETTTAQVAASESLRDHRRTGSQQRVASWGAKQTKQFDSTG